MYAHRHFSRLWLIVASTLAVAASALLPATARASTGPAPVRQIWFADQPYFEPFGMATDSLGRVYIANIANDVSVFAADATVIAPVSDGDEPTLPTPIAHLRDESRNGPVNPVGVAIAEDQSVWVVYLSCLVLRFPPLGSNDPVRAFDATAIVNPDTDPRGLSSCLSIAVDDARDFVYVNDGGNVAQFDVSDATDDEVTPIPAPNHLISGLTGAIQINLDPAGNIAISNGDRIVAFAPDDTDVNAPEWSLTVGPNVAGAAFDADGRIYVGINTYFSALAEGDDPLLVFAPGATGDALPLASIPAMHTSQCPFAAEDSATGLCNVPYLHVSWDGSTLYSGSTGRGDGSRVLAHSTMDLIGVAPSARGADTSAPSDPAPSSDQGAPPVTEVVAAATQQSPEPSPEPGTASAPAATSATSAPAAAPLPSTAPLRSGGSVRASGAGQTCIGGTCVAGSRWSLSVCVPKGAEVAAPGATVRPARGGGCAAGEQRVTIRAGQQPLATSRIVVKQDGKALKRITVRTRA